MRARALLVGIALLVGCGGPSTNSQQVMNGPAGATPQKAATQTGSSLWPSTAVPALADSGPDSAVELGVKFTSAVAGTVTGVRFYKSAANTGTHTANLWSSSGTLLASATFSGESASGWQQANFASAVSILANTVYVASYHTAVGHYSDDQNYFASGGVSSPPLAAPANTLSSPNGVYAYGSASTFPSQGWNASNYWVDLSFTPSGTGVTLSTVSVSPANPTLTPGATLQFAATGTYSDGSTKDLTQSATWASSSPSVATVSAAGLATAVGPGTTTVSATSGGVAGSTTLTVKSAALAIVTTSLPGALVNAAYSATLTASGGTPPYSWSASSGLPPGLALGQNGALTGTPTAVGTYSFTVTVTDAASSSSSASLSMTVSSQCTLWPTTAAPSVADSGPDSAVELGVQFRSDVAGQAIGIRFYKAAGNTGTHLGHLWTASGTLLGSVTFSGETASGWQQANFASPIALAANTVYVASYHTTVGHYSDDQSYFASHGVDSPPLHALANGVSGSNGVYAYGSGSSFPNQGWNASNYWVDVAVAVAVAPPSDTTPPTVTAFSIPSTASTLLVPITTFTATDNVGVTGYLVTESSSKPTSATAGWSALPPTSYTFASAGSKTLYAWAEDAAGNVSASLSASVTITLSTQVPEPAGWYAGDMHVHRSCGGSPDALATMYQMMAPNNLAAISLLADMGNGEVQNPTTDLPLVNGQDASISTPGRIVHWDAEWHWDPTYTQYSHQALGGHIVVLGVSEAQQIWQEYTYPIFEWAHQQGGIAGFAHLQYLDNAIPQGLTCCTPIEYPVEVALGSADFISEDVDDTNWAGDGEPLGPPVGDGEPMSPTAALEAYYRLLNCGFRPGFAAGTDYPCNWSDPLGSLLTYVEVAGGNMTYRNWIDGIALGRTVVSRNAHHEFVNLLVNNTASPGDEVKLPSAGSVTVNVEWTADEALTGTLEIVSNGTVVASQAASVAPGAPATFNSTVSFAHSGWLAARRMDANGAHQVHTAAVFVTVAGAPVRASVDDANFYVQWMDTLLQNTSPGGSWNVYFPTSLSAAQARYQAAKALFQEIATEAAAIAPPTTTSTIFTDQVPTLFDNDGAYELGTRFYSDVNGQVTQVRLYTNALEGGDHTVRIWRAADGALVSGPYTWSVMSGLEGWQSFTLSTPLAIVANTDYIVDVSNSSDHNYAEQVEGFSSPIVNGHLHTYVGSGLYSMTLGTMPTSSWENTNYFRDIVFTP